MLKHGTEVLGLDLAYPGGGGSFGRYVYFRLRPRPAKLPGDVIVLVDSGTPDNRIQISLPFRARELAFDEAFSSAEMPWLLAATDAEGVIHLMRCTFNKTRGEGEATMLTSWAPPAAAFLSPRMDLFAGQMAVIAGSTNGG